MLSTIFKTKEKKLSDSYESYELSDITYNLIEDKLDRFLSHIPPVIKPNLLLTIPFSMTLFYVLILENSIETKEKLKKLSYITKRIGIGSSNRISAGFFIPYLSNEEKSILISVLLNLFDDDLIRIKRYVWKGLQRAFSRKDFYDLEQKEFFYTKDLFNQYFLNAKTILGDALNPLSEEKAITRKNFWLKENNVSYLIKSVEDRIRDENVNLSIDKLNKLHEFHWIPSCL